MLKISQCKGDTKFHWPPQNGICHIEVNKICTQHDFGNGEVKNKAIQNKS
jgi:hypothetical protein